MAPGMGVVVAVPVLVLVPVPDPVVVGSSDMDAEGGAEGERIAARECGEVIVAVGACSRPVVVFEGCLWWARVGVGVWRGRAAALSSHQIRTGRISRRGKRMGRCRSSCEM